MDEEALVDELKRLRKGRGVSPARVAGCPTLCALLGEGRPIELLTARVMELGDSIHARALRNAYAIGLADPLNLTQRRNNFAVRNDKHTDTVEAWENEMITELVHLLDDVDEIDLPDNGDQFLNEALEWIVAEAHVLQLRIEIEHAEESGTAKNDGWVQDFVDEYGKDIAKTFTEPQAKLIAKLMSLYEEREARTKVYWEVIGQLKGLHMAGNYIEAELDRRLEDDE